MFSDDIPKARLFGVPKYRYVVNLVGADVDRGSVRSHNIRVGSSHTVGDTSTVILLGTLCSTGTPKSLKTLPAGSDCTTNRDPTTRNPAFRVTLKRLTGHWLVTSLERRSSHGR